MRTTMLLNLLLPPPVSNALDRACTAVDNARVSVARRLDPEPRDRIDFLEGSIRSRRAYSIEREARVEELERERDEARARIAVLESRLQTRTCIHGQYSTPQWVKATEDQIAQQKIDLKGRQKALTKANARITELESKLIEERHMRGNLAFVAELETELAAYRSSAEAWAERVVVSSISDEEAKKAALFSYGAERNAIDLRGKLIASLPPCRALTEEDVERAAKMLHELTWGATPWDRLFVAARLSYREQARATLSTVGCTFEVKP